LLTWRIIAIKPQTRIVRSGKSYQLWRIRGISAVRNAAPSHKQAGVNEQIQQSSGRKSPSERTRKQRERNPTGRGQRQADEGPAILRKHRIDQ
jgi:hypothetical protein